MADDPTPESDLEGADADRNSRVLKDKHTLAMQRYDACAVPQIPCRAESLQDRRFTDVTGAMWESEFGTEWDDLTPRPEIDKITKNMEKIREDYEENRMEVTFLPADSGDEETADTLNDAFRADAYVHDAYTAWDNGFDEMMKGGMGAWRLTTDYADPYDPDNDNQRINPGVMIPDADQSVWFYGNTKPDGSDAKACFVVTQMTRMEFDDTWGSENAEDFPVQKWSWAWDWYRPDVVQVAEYYVMEDIDDTVYIFTQEQSGEEQRYFKSEIEEGVSGDLKAQGWKRTSKPWKRKRVRKYIMNGTRILKDCGYIAGDCIPVVVVYARVSWVDKVMRFRGYTRKKKDPQRILNSGVGRVQEIDSIAPFEVPIFDPDQLDDVLMQEWAEGNIRRLPFRRARALRNEDGTVVANGPVGKVEAPQVNPTTAALLQFSTAMLSDDDEANEVPANTSAEAIELTQNRIDSKSVLYLNAMREGLKRTATIWRGMAREVYYEPGRELETRNFDGQMGSAELISLTVDPTTMIYKVRNDLTRGTYHVVAEVQEATSTKRQKALRQGMELSAAFMQAQSPQDSVAVLYDAVENMDGIDADTRDYFRQKALAAGIKKPTPEEQKQIEAAQQAHQGQPDPQQIALQAAVQESQSKAQLNAASAEQKQADAALKTAQAEELSKAPAVPTGLSTPANDADVVDKLAGAQLKSAQAQHLHEEMGRKRIMTGHDLEMQRRQQDLAEREQDHAERQPQQG